MKFGNCELTLEDAGDGDVALVATKNNGISWTILLLFEALGTMSRLGHVNEGLGFKLDEKERVELSFEDEG